MIMDRFDALAIGGEFEKKKARSTTPAASYYQIEEH
jgi:hypothetical protein